MPTGPTASSKITEGYARLVVSDAFFWAWPMANVYNRRVVTDQEPDVLIVEGAPPLAPLNRLAMFTDPISPGQRLLACPDPNVIYGMGAIALDRSPVVIQVPDFDDRFWVYDVVDVRTDSFADLGKMYGTTPGFYLLVGPTWHGQVPKGITKVFRASSNTGYVITRVFQDDSSVDQRAVQATLSRVMIYPLAEFNGELRHQDRMISQEASNSVHGGDTEVSFVFPERFVDELPAVLADAPPLPGEEARYAQIRAVLDAATGNPKLKEALTRAVIETDAQVEQLLAFRNWGLQLPHNWSTVLNGAAFGTDYYTRTAVAKSNIFASRPEEIKNFYQDLDASGAKLNGANRYTVTFARDRMPPVNGPWSLALYNEHHFFVPNDIHRYSVGTNDRTLKHNPDGSLTIYIQPDPPAEDRRANWLPAPRGADFSLYLRAYWPKVAVIDGSWTPPAVQVLE